MSLSLSPLGMFHTTLRDLRCQCSSSTIPTVRGNRTTSSLFRIDRCCNTERTRQCWKETQRKRIKNHQSPMKGTGLPEKAADRSWMRPLLNGKRRRSSSSSWKSKLHFSQRSMPTAANSHSMSTEPSLCRANPRYRLLQADLRLGSQGILKLSQQDLKWE